MTNKEIIEKHWKVGNIINCRWDAYLIIDEHKAINTNGFVYKDSLSTATDSDFTIISVWKLGDTPGLGLGEILKTIHTKGHFKSITDGGIGQAIEIWNCTKLPFDDCKVFAGSKSEEVQHCLFKLGWKWYGTTNQEIMKSATFIYMNDGYLSYSSVEEGYEYFKNQEFKEISISSILNYESK